MIVLKLQNIARDWFEEEMKEVTKWENFRDEIIKRFAKRKIHKWMEEIRKIKQQKNEKVGEYSVRFRSLIKKIGADEEMSDIMFMKNYVEGLKKEYRMQTIRKNAENLKELMRDAEHIEDIFESIEWSKYTKNEKILLIGMEQKKCNTRCRKCKKTGHKGNECKQ
jgi:hypothetical protein